MAPPCWDPVAKFTVYVGVPKDLCSPEIKSYKTGHSLVLQKHFKAACLAPAVRGVPASQGLSG